jgi:protein-disulfide isomerase
MRRSRSSNTPRPLAAAVARFMNQGKPAIDDGVERGDVRFVFREMLTGQPNLARAGFMLARCAPEDQYLDVIDLLFEQQRALFSAMQQGNAQGQFQTIARTAGFSRTRNSAPA